MSVSKATPRWRRTAKGLKLSLYVVGAAAAVALAVFALGFREAFQEHLSRYFTARDRGPRLAPHERELVDEWRWINTARARSGEMRETGLTLNIDMERPSLDSIVIENTTDSPVGNFWFYREGMPNFYSSQTLVESVTAGKGTDADKAVALWELFPRHFYNDWSLEKQIANDPVTLLAVLGSGRKFHATKVLRTLCQMLGLKTRDVGLILGGAGLDHGAVEVFADGRWVFLDPDGLQVYPMDDGRIANVEDLLDNPDLVRRLKGTPMDRRAYDLEGWARAFETGAVRIFKTDEDLSLAQTQLEREHLSPHNHVMRFDLLPRRRITLDLKRTGKLSRFMRHVERPFYANGRLEYSFDSRRLEGMKTQDGNALVPVTSPYMIVGGRLTGYATKSGSVRFLPLLKDEQPEGWVEVFEGRGSFSVSLDDELNAHEQPLFGYVLDVSPNVQSIDIVSDLQFPPRSVPHLSQGANRFFWYSDEADLRIRVSDFLSHAGYASFQAGTRRSDGYGVRVTFHFRDFVLRE